MPTCPFCAEDIANGAVKCKHCGEWLSQPLAVKAGNIRHEAQVIEEPKSQSAIPYVLLALAVLYTLSPVDLVPDVVPVAGWFDDFFALAAAGLNVLQNGLGKQNKLLEQIVGLLKWGLIVVGTLVVLVVVLLGTAVIKLFSSW